MCRYQHRDAGDMETHGSKVTPKEHYTADLDPEQRIAVKCQNQDKATIVRILSAMQQSMMAR